MKSQLTGLVTFTVESTEGYGNKAMVNIDGEILEVQDLFSDPDRSQGGSEPCDLILGKWYVGTEDLPGQQNRENNPHSKMYLEQNGGWSYTAYGQLKMKDNEIFLDCGNVVLPVDPSDPHIDGRFVKMKINRLSIIKFD